MVDWRSLCRCTLRDRQRCSTLLDRAGARRIGSTAMTELAYEPSGYNAVHGAPKNPWNFDYVTGGSSSGSAVAVASGSVSFRARIRYRRLAAHSGALLWRHLVEADLRRRTVASAMPLSPSLDTVGILARSASDLQEAARILYAVREADPVRTVAVVEDVLDLAEAPIANACGNAIEAIGGCGIELSRTEGVAAVETLDPHVFTVMQAEAARAHRTLMDSGVLDATLMKRLRKGLEINDKTLAASIAARPQLVADFLARTFQNAQAIALPVLTTKTPAASANATRARLRSTRKRSTSSAAGPASSTCSDFRSSRSQPDLTTAAYRSRCRSSAARARTTR